ncbi:MAG: glycosyl transferase [Symploca sp. SIO2G7]|nr:glycosyl transferase [Symploca sp. SIO2G7]
MLKSSNLITVACCLLPVACPHQSIFDLVQDLSLTELDIKPNMFKISLPLVPSLPKFSITNFQPKGITRSWVLGLVITLGVLLGTLCCSIWDQVPTPTSPVFWSSEAQWIGSKEPTYRFYARRSFNLGDTEAGGWLRLSADNDFILYVNNLVVARELSDYGQIPRNTLGLASQSTDPYQNFNDSRPYSLGVRDWVQWSYPQDWKLTNYVDLTPYLQPGRNVIALEVQKSRTNPRAIVEGAIYTPDSDSSIINLTTGETPWRISTLAENQEQLRWFDQEFNDLNWSEAAILGQPTQKTYSRISQHLFAQPLLGNWISGNQSELGEVWLRGIWQIPPQRQRAFIRFAGQGNYSLLINGSLVKYDDTGDNQLLHLYEVTNLLRGGSNTLTVRLSRSIETDGSNNTGLVGFYLDGWLETETGEAIAPIVTDENWTTEAGGGRWQVADGNPDEKIFTTTNEDQSLRVSVSPRLRVYSQETELAQSATFLRQPHLPEFKRQFEGNAALLNYPKYLWHQILWSLGGIFLALIGTWSLGLLLLKRRQEGNPPCVPGKRQVAGGRWQEAGSRKQEAGSDRVTIEKQDNREENCFLSSFSTRNFILFPIPYSLFPASSDANYSLLIWDSLAAGTILLLPGILFLLGIGLLKHRYGEAELALQFAGSQSNQLILAGFFVIVSLTLLWSLIRFKREQKAEGKRQKAEAKRQKAKGRKQKAKGKRQKAKSRKQKAKGRKQKAKALPQTRQKTVLRKDLGANNLSDNLSVKPKLDNPNALPFNSWKIRPSHWWVFASIITIGFGLRLYRLGFIDLDPDANVSLDCVRGILRTGAPISTSGIWYTRGPFYHYALAAWLRFVGDSDFNAALFSVLLGTATLVVIYFLAKQISGKIWIALLITAVLAIDPWEIWYSRNIRFYQITQFLYLLGFWAFLPGFITSRKPAYQAICFVSLTLMLLTQEVTITLLPTLAIGAFYFYLPFRSAHDWRLLLVASLMAFIYAYDGIFVMIKCLTEVAGMSSLTTNYLKLYLSGNITYYITDFFVGFNRMKVIYTVFYLGGLVYFLLRKDKVKLFLYSTILINIIFVTVVVLFEGSRYTYPLYPLFVLLSIYSACHLAEIFGEKLTNISGNLLPFKLIVISSVLTLLLFNIEPIRILSSYQDSITARHIQVTEYIKNHKQPGDIVISNVPSVHSNLLGGADYFIPHRMSFFDAVYWRDGQLVDRWEGGIVVTNADQLKEILTQNQRVWLHLLYTPQLPSDIEIAKFHDLLETLGEPVLETFGTTLRLWDSKAGVLPRLVNQGKEFGSY